LDEEASDTVAGEQPCEPGQHRPIRRFERWPVHLAAENRHLVAQHGNLDGDVRVAATDEADQLKHAAERPVEEGEDHRRMLTAPDASRQSASRSPWTTFSARTGRCLRAGL
jgi:hypothetical protein